MSRLGWLVVHVETTETITTLHHGCESEEEATEWGKQYVQNAPPHHPDDIFVLEDLNQPEKRVSVMEALMEEVRQDGR